MGVLTLADEASAPSTPADGASVYSAAGIIKYKTDGGTVHTPLTDQANGLITNTMLATDIKVGSLAALTTTAKSNAVAAINEIDAQVNGSIDADGTLKAGAVDVAAVLADDVITNEKLATAIKIGSLTALNTAARGSVVAAINELDAEIATLVAPSGDSIAEVVAARGGYADLDTRLDTFVIRDGVAGGQTLSGGTAANEDLTLQGTAHATNTTSYVYIQPTGGRVKAGGDSSSAMVSFELSSSIPNAPWTIAPFLGSFLSVPDPTLEIGYNIRNSTRLNLAESAIWIGMEADYANNVLQAGGETKHYHELYFGSLATDGTNRRFFAFTIDRDAPDDYMWSDLSVSPTGRFAILRSTDGAALFNFGGTGILGIWQAIQFPNNSPYIQSTTNSVFSVITNGKFVSFSPSVDGLLFGSSSDAILYRPAAGTLQSNGKLLIEQNLGVGSLSPAAMVHISQNVNNAAVPVLLLDQQDISEEFIKFVGTSTTDASQSLVDAADLSTPGAIIGWVKVSVRDDAVSGGIADGIAYMPLYAAPTA